jgi:cell division protein FtsN
LNIFTLTTLKKKVVVGALFFLAALAVHARGGNDPAVTVTTPFSGSRLIEINWTQVKNPQQNMYTLYRASRADHSFTAIKTVAAGDRQVLDENLDPPLGNYFYFITHEGFDKLNQGIKITEAEIAAQLATLPESERVSSGSSQYGGNYPNAGYTGSPGAQNTAAFNQNIRPLNEGISLGLVIFNNKVVSESALLPLDPAGRQELIERLNAAFAPSHSNGTALYYAEHSALAALNRLEAARALPVNLESVNLVTVTAGLDTSSTDMSLPPPDATGFAGKQSAAYRNFINQQIKTRRVGGKRIDAWAIGAPGRDTVNSGEFQAALTAIASSPENIFFVNNIAEAEIPLLGIADTIKISAQRSSLMFTTPAYSIGTTVRITFDNVYHPDSANQYIEGRVAYNNNTYTLTNLNARGLPLAVKGSVTGKRGDAGIEYTIAIDDDFPDSSIMQWYKANSLAGDDWQQNSEFKTLKLNDYTSGRKSSVIYLVLDCSSAISDAGIESVREAAIQFIDKLYYAGGTYDFSPGPAVVLPGVLRYNQNILPRTGSLPEIRAPARVQNALPESRYPPPAAIEMTRTQVLPSQSAQYAQIQLNPPVATLYSYVQNTSPEVSQRARVQSEPSATLPPARQAMPLPTPNNQPELTARNLPPAYLNTHLPPKYVDWSAPYSGFWVQVGSYTDINFAQDCWRKLWLAGCTDTEIFSKVINGVTYYRVKAGPYQDRRIAESARDILRAFDPAYNNSYVVKQ